MLRGLLALIVVGLVMSVGCSRRETEAQMRERVQREERQREERQLLDKERKLRQELATPKSEAEVERLKKQLDAVKAKMSASMRAPMTASMTASMSASMSASMTASMSSRKRYKAAAPAPRRRLKRPRRRRSPSLEGLFE